MTDTVELTTHKANLLRDKIAQVVQDNKKSCMDLAMVLHEAYISTTVVNNEIVYVYQSWGYDDWAEFVRKEVGMYKTTADQYRKVWRVFGIDLAGAWSQDELLPITKMRILSSADLDKRNVSSWLKKAKDMSCLALQVEIFGHDRVHNVNLPCTTSEMESITKSIDGYRNFIGEETPRGSIVALALKQWVAEQKKKHRLRKVG